ncbi:hypothetical protein FQR65_LT03867 [Abscondita terminalis]|nr:hypothetical protein FQR65_LT03867 [Abscondita terminalis]
METILPSSNLLEELLSEPLYTWKNGKRVKQSHKNKLKRPPLKIMRRSLVHQDNDTPSAGSDTNSSIESLSTKTTTDQPPLVENEYEETVRAMALLPGLKTKPPIPKKPDLNAQKTENKNNTQTFDCNLPPSFSENIDFIASTSTLESGDAPETKVQNWFQDQNVTEDIKRSELNTDKSIENLKFKQSEKRAFSDSETEAPFANENSKNHLHKIAYSPKHVNFEDFDINMKGNYEKRKSTKNFVKENIKLSTKNFRKKISDSDSDDISASTNKFTPTPMKSFPDYKEPPRADVESWMSTIVTENQNENLKSSFLDCLSKVQELQETCINLDSGSEIDAPESGLTNQGDNNTYDDIIAILQTLEEQEKKSESQMRSIKRIVTEELSSTENENSDHLKPKSDESAYNSSTTQSDLGDFFSPKSNRRNLSNSSTNLNDIFLFLDQVEKSSAQSVPVSKEKLHPIAPLESNLQLDTIPKFEELLEHTNVELSNYVIQLNLRLKEKSSAIAVLQKELSSLREQITKMTKTTSEIIKERLKSQKDDYESAVKRHQKFIDQLISDKKTRNHQYESLVKELKTLEERYKSNMKAVEHKHKVEIQKVKEMHIAGEKIRKERWIDSKTQKIKELTIKGIEPELDKMTSRHQQELMDLRTLHKREIEDMELRAARKLQQHCECLREQLTAEREKALAHERDVLRQRYERMVETEEQNFQEQRRKLLADHAKRISECDERENNALIEKDRCVKQAQIEYEDKLQAAIRKHNIELNLLKEKTELEMETFRNNYKKQIVLQLGEKEALIREKCRKDRDKEIEAVIERLELEANETKSQMEQAFDNRIRRLKEKYEKEIIDLEKSEKESNKKYCDTKIKLSEAEDAVVALKTTISQLESQLFETKTLSERLTKERENMRDIVKDEMRQELTNLEKEVYELKTEKEKELHKVYAS